MDRNGTGQGDVSPTEDKETRCWNVRKDEVKHAIEPKIKAENNLETLGKHEDKQLSSCKQGVGLPYSSSLRVIA